MNTPAIILGDPSGILNLPKAGLRNRENWTQIDSDILAHPIQVQKQIQLSRWYRTKVQFTIRGSHLLDHSFPDLESFVFASVYLRQLIAKKDNLLEDAVDRFCRFADCRIRPSWIGHELLEFKSALDGPTSMLPDYTVRELFDAFMYGAALLHKMPSISDAKRKRFLELYDNQPRHTLLYTLHISLKTLMNHVNNITAVIYRDYSHWLNDYGLPPPDTRWHDKLFELKARSAADCKNDSTEGK